MSLHSDHLQQAVQAARAGERARALELFLAYVEQDETNPQAWLWISELVESEADQVTALENARDLLAPGTEMHSKIGVRLNALRKDQAQDNTRPAALYTPPFVEDPRQDETVKELIDRARQLHAAGEHAEALDVLDEAALAYSDCESIWLALSELHPDPLAKIRALERALEIEPGNPQASRRLENLRPMEKDPMKRGSFLQEQGEQELAIAVYLSVVTHSRLPSERLEARRRIEDIRLRQEADHIRKVSPTVTLLRLASGPVLLFATMVFLQSGLNPLHTPLLAIPGLFSVLAGSLILSASGMHPAHPQWSQIIGAHAAVEEPELQRGIRLLGWALLIAPYTMFFIEAGHRLGILQASMLAR